MELMEHHLIQPTKVHTMIQAFMETLAKDTRTIIDNTVIHEATFEELSYCIVLSLYNQLKIWTTYIRDKST